MRVSSNGIAAWLVIGSASLGCTGSADSMITAQGDRVSSAGRVSASARVFWAETNAVMSAALDGSDVRVVAGAPLAPRDGAEPPPAPAMFPDGVAVDAAAGALYWADNGSDTITVADLDGCNPRVIYQAASPRSNPSAIAVDGTAARMFWVETNAVMSAALDGGDVQAVVGAPLGPDDHDLRLFPGAVAVDAQAGKLYWADSGSDAIAVSSYDGTDAAVIYQSGNPFANPNAIAVDAEAGRLFWTEANAVMSAALDGSDLKAVAGAPLPPWSPDLETPPPPITAFPSGVAVDPVAGWVYWTDNGTDRITRSRDDGTGAEVVYDSGNRWSNPNQLAASQASTR